MIKTMIPKGRNQFLLYKRDENCTQHCNIFNGFGNNLININKMKTYPFENEIESVRDERVNHNKRSNSLTKSKLYEMNNKRLDNIKTVKSRRKPILHGPNMSNNIVILSIMVLFCCWNCGVFAFHLNEESNSVYPKVKSIPSSTFSHKRHSKTVEVFYPSGVSFDSIIILLYANIEHKEYEKKLIMVIIITASKIIMYFSHS